VKELKIYFNEKHQRINSSLLNLTTRQLELQKSERERERKRVERERERERDRQKNVDETQHNKF
jgi:hypothetical protein